jgi:hypothetical protein
MPEIRISTESKISSKVAPDIIPPNRTRSFSVNEKRTSVNGGLREVELRLSICCG